MEGKVTKLGLVVKGYKDKIADMQFSYEMNTEELQMKLQSTTPKEVREQREADLKVEMTNISTIVVDCG